MTSPEVTADWIDDVAHRLPPFPRVVRDLLDLLNDEGVSLDVLARCVRDDPVIAAEVLAAANRMRRLRLLPELRDSYVAASCIGTNKLRAIVVTAGMNRFLSFGRAETFFFEHSLAVAIVAQELATLASISPEEAYVAGILHDIGQLAFFVADGDSYRTLLRDAFSDGSLLARERDAFGIDHGQAGVLMACAWGMPTEIVQAIAAHHQDRIACTCKLQAVVNLAETVARGLDLPPSQTNRVASVNASALQLLGLCWDSPQMVDCLGRCRARIGSVLE